MSASGSVSVTAVQAPAAGCLRRRWPWAARSRRAAPHRSERMVKAGARFFPEPAQALQAYDEDLRHYPANAWSLQGRARALEALGVPLKGALELHFTYDEEFGGLLGPGWLLEQKLTRPDYVIAAGFSYNIVTAHNACLQLEITVHGKSGHGAMPETGHDALRAYLDSAKLKLAGNPDRDEIVRDLAAAAVGLPLVVVGDGPLRGVLERTIGELGLAPHVRLAGNLSDAEMHTLLSRAWPVADGVVDRPHQRRHAARRRARRGAHAGARLGGDPRDRPQIGEGNADPDALAIDHRHGGYDLGGRRHPRSDPEGDHRRRRLADHGRSLARIEKVKEHHGSVG